MPATLPWTFSFLETQSSLQDLHSWGAQSFLPVPSSSSIALTASEVGYTHDGLTWASLTARSLCPPSALVFTKITGSEHLSQPTHIAL